VKAVIWEPPARQELDDALAVSQDAAEFQRTVDEAIQDVASGRVVHAAVPGTRCRRCILTRVPYSIIYTETDDEIRVFAFPHHKRRTGYWKRRLRPN
jgi:plasmid stabilization system protein ParE